MKIPDEKEFISSIVKSSVMAYAEGFECRHVGEVDNPEGVINMKIHNVFIEALGKEIQYYTALSRSLDSSLGNMLEKMAISLAEQNYVVKQNVEGPLYNKQTQLIANILEQYKRHSKKPEISDYACMLEHIDDDENHVRHDSDYYLYDEENDHHYLIELKIGGDLDNKKARAEKEAILEQYAILSNLVGDASKITIYFATAYNRYGEDKVWRQERVKQFFGADELLIGKDFWNFICKSENGYKYVLESYRENAHYIKEALDRIKATYLGD
jgi:hypothetical protein